MIPVQILRCVLKGQEHIVQTKGSGEPKDSRQRLELLAVLAGLSRMVKPSEITIKGSGYIKTGFQYLNTWQKADWKKILSDCWNGWAMIVPLYEKRVAA